MSPNPSHICKIPARIWYPVQRVKVPPLRALSLHEDPLAFSGTTSASIIWSNMLGAKPLPSGSSQTSLLQSSRRDLFLARAKNALQEISASKQSVGCWQGFLLIIFKFLHLAIHTGTKSVCIVAASGHTDLTFSR